MINKIPIQFLILKCSSFKLNFICLDFQIFILFDYCKWFFGAIFAVLEKIIYDAI